MKLLVYGATGTVGSVVARELIQRGHQIRALTRHPEKARTLGASVEIVQGDALDPQTLRTVFKGVDGVFLLNPVSLTEAAEGLMGVSGAMTAGIQRIVYLSVHDADKGAYLPHIGSKMGVEAGLRVSGVPYTILRPNNFYQNDYWLQEAIVQYGVYPQPIGEAGVSRVDVRDIAEAAAITLTTNGHEGRTYNVDGPDPLTGPRTAQIWGQHLGREVKYAGNDLDAWEKAALQAFPPWMAYDLKLMYGHFQKYGLKATSEDVSTLTKLLGHPPRRFEDFAAETARAWKTAGAAARN